MFPKDVAKKHEEHYKDYCCESINEKEGLAHEWTASPLALVRLTLLRLMRLAVSKK